MLTETTLNLHLSQGHLKLLETCPRKFQHTYLEELNSPSNPEQQENQTLGSRFHLLMQQREMGLPIDSLLEGHIQLQKWMLNFTNVAPEILTPTQNQSFRASEHYRTLQLQNYLLTVVYDLLITDREKAQILDWKTYPTPPKDHQLQENWQTRLYLYVLAETSAYLPENISMTYWFVQSEGQPPNINNIKFNYNTTQHQQIGKRLDQLLNQLTNWLEDYQTNQFFPQVRENSKICNDCHFAPRCHRTQAREKYHKNYLPDFANIQEVSL
ncbi:PD-(D/E)XK nuclease family protein [Chrysosporum bergii ANA360D]|jgi:hypothetical protein|uniref:PD-(D/E)XK nuclease family protein n=1 Tax=Chrysosporum bergii ANA360D TaxID=617107 RepID=A0AA43GQI1_9CYAN|nr:PD-(D/E)XK nuclease family protein [Chrysosporum bergii]MDH6059764.1 PD-(D/E)XK nuclease family protein [Chrysosporum bergii ANA360D]